MKNFDIFIDEEKNLGYLGFLVTTNTPALQQILFNIREANQNYRKELKFVSLSNNGIHVALSWLNVFFNNDCNVFFVYRKWNGDISNKKNSITKTIQQINENFQAKGNIVTFMDFDSNHKNLNIQNQILSHARICRCYHLDSKCFDMLQLCDLLLQCAIKTEITENFNRAQYSTLMRKFNNKENLEKSKLKKLLVLHSIKQNLKNKKIGKSLPRKVSLI